MTTKTLIVMGNGPSLKTEYFDIIKRVNVHTIGMNAAYRFYDQIKWWPTYFCCFDYALTESHRDAWSKMILDPKIPIQKYFFIDVKQTQKTFLYETLGFSEEVRKHPKFSGRKNNQDFIGYPEYGVKKKINSTGANSVRLGIELGYKDIILIGHDCRYKQSENFKEAKKITGWKYKMDQTPENNPNYFWKGYQLKGDIFHKPGDQLPSWKNLKECVVKYAPGIRIFNCSQGTRIKYWQYVDFEYVLKKLNILN